MFRQEKSEKRFCRKVVLSEFPEIDFWETSGSPDNSSLKQTVLTIAGVFFQVWHELGSSLTAAVSCFSGKTESFLTSLSSLAAKLLSEGVRLKYLVLLQVLFKLSSSFSRYGTAVHYLAAHRQGL